MKLSQKLADFNVEVNELVPYINVPANATRLKLDAATLTESNNLLTDWNTNWGAYSNIATHTPQTVIDINASYHDFHLFTGGLKSMLKGNRLITLTGPDIANIHIHVNEAHRTHIPRPNFAPANQVIKTIHLVNRIFTSNPQPSFENETSLPTDVQKVGRKLAVMFPNPGPIPGGGPQPTPGEEQYHHLESIGSTQYDLVFAPEQEGAIGYLITWYINPRGEAGPPSVPFAFKII